MGRGVELSASPSLCFKAPHGAPSKPPSRPAGACAPAPATPAAAGDLCAASHQRHGLHYAHLQLGRQRARDVSKGAACNSPLPNQRPAQPPHTPAQPHPCISPSCTPLRLPRSCLRPAVAPAECRAWPVAGRAGRSGVPMQQRPRLIRVLPWSFKASSGACMVGRRGSALAGAATASAAWPGLWRTWMARRRGSTGCTPWRG